MKKLLVICVVALAGCATGDLGYTGPQAVATPGTNSVIVAQSRDDAWNSAIPRLGKQFFVINTMDRQSGLINLSYSGDPERYVDCGHIHAVMTNIRGTQVYDFPGAASTQYYEYINESHQLLLVNRTMALEGRINLVFEAIDPLHTRVTASTRYVVNRTVDMQLAGTYERRHVADSVAFNTQDSAIFGGNRTNPTVCTGNGRLETELLDAVKG